MYKIRPNALIDWFDKKGHVLPTVTKAVPKSILSSESFLDESDYWQGLCKKVEVALEEFPSWSKTVRTIKKAANLQDWLTDDIGLSSREAEIVKKVLSEKVQRTKLIQFVMLV